VAQGWRLHVATLLGAYMKDCKIYIHTAGRAAIALPSIARLPPVLWDSAVVLVQEHEYDAYRDRLAKDRIDIVVQALPATIRTLSPTRQWIIDHCPTPYVIIMDDDVVFNTRRADISSLCISATQEDMLYCFRYMRELLHRGCVHIGVAGKEHSNVRVQPLLYIGRVMRTLGYRVDILRSVDARFDRIPCKQDFDMTLQLLRLGYPNYIINWITQGQYGSGRQGGCSQYRDSTMLHDTAHALRDLHPEFVRIVHKNTKNAWGGGARDDVVVQWRRAYESSK